MLRLLNLKQQPICLKEQGKRKQGAKNIARMATMLQDPIIFCDESRIPCDEPIVCTVQGSAVLLGHTAGVYDAEVVGALAGLQGAQNNTLARLATDITVCLDNQEAALRLATGIPTSTSYKDLIKFYNLATRWNSHERSIYAPAGGVYVQCCQVILGNEQADQLAKKACKEVTSRKEISLARAKILTDKHYEDAVAANWQANAPE